jgi:MFS family permease
MLSAGASQAQRSRFATPSSPGSSSYPLTLSARLLAGAMDGTLWAILVGYAARMVAAERRGRAIAIVLAGSTSRCAWASPPLPPEAREFGMTEGSLAHPRR